MSGNDTYRSSSLLRGRSPWTEPIYGELQRFRAANPDSLPRVSVLVPSLRNEETAMYESVTSLARSYYPTMSFEVLVLMDVMDYNAQVVASELSRKYANVVPTPAAMHGGASDISAALNTGLGLSMGSIVGLVGARDLLGRIALLEAAYLIAEKGYEVVRVPPGKEDHEPDRLREAQGRTGLAGRLGLLRGSADARSKHDQENTGNAENAFQASFFDRDVLARLGGWERRDASEGFGLDSRLNRIGVKAIQSTYLGWKVHLSPTYIPFKSSIYTAEFYERHAEDYANSYFETQPGSRTGQEAQEAQEPGKQEVPGDERKPQRRQPLRSQR